MRYLKTYESLNMGSYYDPPDNDDSLYDGVLDNLWSVLIEDGYSEDIIEIYVEYLEYDKKIYNFIYDSCDDLSDDDGYYPWSEDMENKYRKDYHKLQQENKNRLQIEISKLLYKFLKKSYPIDDFILKYNAEKYNL